MYKNNLVKVIWFVTLFFIAFSLGEIAVNAEESLREPQTLTLIECSGRAMYSRSSTADWKMITENMYGVISGKIGLYMFPQEITEDEVKEEGYCYFKIYDPLDADKDNKGIQYGLMGPGTFMIHGDDGIAKFAHVGFLKPVDENFDLKTFIKKLKMSNTI